MGGKTSSHWVGPDLCGLCTGFGVAIAEQLLFWLVLKPHVLPLFSADRRLSISLRNHDDLLLHLCPAPRLCPPPALWAFSGRRRVRIAMLDATSPLWCFTLPLLVLLGLVLHRHLLPSWPRIRLERFR